MSIHKDINLFSSSSVGKTVLYHGSILPELNQGEYFNITEHPSDEVYRIGHGASSVNLVNEDVHLTLIGSSRLINDSFGEIISTIDDFEVEETIEESVFTQSVGPMGPIGPRGEQGEQGFPGIPGRDGKDGKDGIDGNQGEKGEPGERGEDGQQGPQGEHGLQGEQGPQGERGERGPQGEQGVQGEIGSVGPEGPRGERGERGEQGIQGEHGVQGSDGKQGERGPQGERGERGERGLQGERGSDGLRGEDGKPGEQGPKGEQGERGEDGIARVSGPLLYDSSTKVLSVSEKWVESLGSIIQNGAIVGGGGDLFGIKKDGVVVPRGNVIRFIDFRGDNITVSADGVDGIVNIESTTETDTTNLIFKSGGNNKVQQDLDLDNFSLYNARLDGGTF